MPMLPRFVLLVAALTSVAAGAIPSPERAYVLGRHAFAEDDLARASRYFAGALVGDPNDPTLARRAFDLAVASGNERQAVALAPRLAKSDQFDAALSLLAVTEAVEKRDWLALDAARKKLADAGFAAFAAPVIEAWGRFGRGDKAGALKLLDPASQEGFGRSYLIEHRGHMLAAMQRSDEAASTYGLLLGGDGANIVRLRLAAASALQAGGKIADAKKLLEGGGHQAAFEIALARLAAGQPIRGGVEDPRAGIAGLFTRMAADLSRDKPLPIALVLARYATFLAPGDADAWLVTSDVLARNEQDDGALEALANIKSDDPLITLSRARQAILLQRIDRQKESLVLLEQAAAAQTPVIEDWARLGEGYNGASRYADAATAYSKALALVTVLGPEHWYLYFARGAARERAGDWIGAQVDLRQAIALAPGEASALNYLGYALLDRGERMPEAQALIERAVAAKPDDGFIADSLGWAYFHTGKYAQAVVQLERAVAAVANDPTINEHLGDAYWKVGRKIEARFRWKAALDAEPEKVAAERVSAKLDYGLDVASAMASRKP